MHIRVIYSLQVLTMAMEIAAKITMTADQTYVPVGGNVSISCISYVKGIYIEIYKGSTIHITCSKFGCQKAFPNITLTIPVRDNTIKEYDLWSFDLLNFQIKDNGTYTCGDGNKDNNVQDSVTITYKVSITTVTLTPTIDLVNMVDGVPFTFYCVTSDSRPPATVSWFKGSENITAFSTSVTSNFITNSSLMYTPSKADQGKRIRCKGNNGGTSVTSSTMPQANIQFGPSVPDCDYAGADAPSTTTVQEGWSFSLECTSSGNPPPNLTWTHPGPGPTSPLTLSNIQKIHNGTFTVTSSNTLTPYGVTHFPLSDFKSYIVQVMYPPESIQCTVGSASPLGPGTLRVVKGSTFIISCVADSFPASTWAWSWSDGSGSDYQLSVPNIQTEGPFTVIARNTMSLTNGSTETGRMQNEYSLQLLYPPSSPTFHFGGTTGPNITGNSLSVIRGNTITVACVSAGNPEPKYTSWNGDGQNWTFVTSSDISRTCKASNTLDPTGYKEEPRSVMDTLNVKVLYPPESAVLYFRDCLNKTVAVTAVKVIEGHQVHVTCGANGNPAPAYTWSSYQSGEDVFLINGALRSQQGTYSCNATNRMDVTFGDPVPGSNTKPFTLDILYPPEIAPLKTVTVIEGYNASSTCHVTPGFPIETNFNWTRNTGMIAISSSETLQFISINRTQAGSYKCTAWNVMQPTGCDHVNGTSSQELIVDVQYKAAVTDFKVANSDSEEVVLDEGVPVAFDCEVDSNPGAIIVLQKAGHPIKEVNNSQSIHYVVTSSQCEDEGTYGCTGSNVLNNVSDKKTLEVFVKCSPRISTQSSSVYNVTAGTSSLATLTFKFIAYPRPSASDVTWEKHDLQTDNWTVLYNTSDITITLSKNSLQTMVSVIDVKQGDFGQYRVTISNELGSITEHFLLKAEEMPSGPHNLQSSDRATESSITITWIPGFDGGLPQTFIVQFRETSTVKWKEEDVEAGHTNHTIYNLKAGTTYEVQMIARNSLGKSPSSETITVTTIKSLVTVPPPPELAAIIGGPVGGLAGIGSLAIVLFVILKRRRKAESKEDACNQPNDHKMHSMSDSHSIQDDEDDEVINPIYEGGGGDQNLPADAIYSKPSKKKHDQGASGDVYAVVNKPKKPKATKQSSKSKDKTTKSDDIYENSAKHNKTKGGNINNGYDHDDVSGKDKPRKNVNQDGLIYADLVFPYQPKGQKRLVIHGLDDMTEYAEVDLTKRADPLPESDDQGNEQR